MSSDHAARRSDSEAMTAEDLTRYAAGALVVGFAGTTPPDALLRAVAGGLGGVVLFTRNVRDAEQLTALTATLRAERADVLVAIDHEGGEFSHLSAVSRWPLASPRCLGDLDDPALTRASAREAGVLLAGLGIDVMLAPSVDVNSNPANPIISTRSFGTGPDVVSRHGAAFVAGVHEAGIAACAKHFPGHGDVAVDSHLALPHVDRWAEEVAAVELPPFAAAIAAGVDLVMTAHIVFSDYDTVPATLSRRLLTGLLRDELGFTGVVTTDALEMHGITADRSIEQAAVESITAGADLAMVATADADPAALTAALVDAVGNGSLPAGRLVEAADRVRRLGADLSGRRAAVDTGERGDFSSPDDEDVPHPEPGAAVREVARRVIAGQDVPRLGPAPYVVDLAQPVHPAWHPYFDGLPELFAAPSEGVVVRQHDPGAIGAAVANASGRALLVAVQDAVRTPWMADALGRLLAAHAGPVVVLCTGIPEDRALVPDGVPAVVTSGRNLVVLHAVAESLTHGRARWAG
jgi:beta-N-acetylhexosaminidase